jgi:hypothetical protein
MATFVARLTNFTESKTEPEKNDFTIHHPTNQNMLNLDTGIPVHSFTFLMAVG